MKYLHISESPKIPHKDQVRGADWSVAPPLQDHPLPPAPPPLTQILPFAIPPPPQASQISTPNYSRIPPPSPYLTEDVYGMNPPKMQLRKPQQHHRRSVLESGMNVRYVARRPVIMYCFLVDMRGCVEGVRSN